MQARRKKARERERQRERHGDRQRKRKGRIQRENLGVNTHTYIVLCIVGKTLSRTGARLIRETILLIWRKERRGGQGGGKGRVGVGVMTNMEHDKGGGRAGEEGF